MILSMSRWVSPSLDTAFIELSSDSAVGVITVTQYSIKDSDSVAHTYSTTSLGSGIYSYAIDKNIVYTDNFKIYENGIIVANFQNDTSSTEPDAFNNIDFSFSEMPRGEMESSRVVNKIYRLWGGGDSRKISIANSTASQVNAYELEATVADTLLFENCFKPVTITRDAFNELLIDPIALFEGETGKTFVIEEENKVVIPLSNGSSTWSEEYNYDSFLSIGINYYERNTINNTLYDDLRITSEQSFAVNFLGALYRTYEISEIPTTFRSDISLIEQERSLTSVQVSKWGIGESVYSDFIIEQPGGLIAGSIFR